MDLTSSGPHMNMAAPPHNMSDQMRAKNIRLNKVESLVGVPSLLPWPLLVGGGGFFSRSLLRMTAHLHLISESSLASSLLLVKMPRKLPSGPLVNSTSHASSPASSPLRACCLTSFHHCLQFNFYQQTGNEEIRVGFGAACLSRACHGPTKHPLARSPSDSCQIAGAFASAVLAAFTCGHLLL